MDFEKGDLVRLKSGGPVMTVENVGELHLSGEESVWCVWFEKAGNKQVIGRDSFPPFTLEKAQRPGVASFAVVRG
ncbi:MAG TPA: DUF2158 domain-containing protein [Allosphingosinicella sp.]|jgi:uncharacterized protein YodC (DUF2158 family)